MYWSLRAFFRVIPGQESRPNVSVYLLTFVPFEFVRSVFSVPQTPVIICVFSFYHIYVLVKSAQLEINPLNLAVRPLPVHIG